MTTSESTKLRLAVCLYPGVTSLDFIGPIESFAILGGPTSEAFGPMVPKPIPYTMEATYLNHNLEPVAPFGIGPKYIIDQTYQEATGQFDIILIPGGDSEDRDSTLIEFLNKQAPGAKYILSVCNGSAILASAGILDGKKATTNKMLFSEIKAASSKSISWIPKARWVVDGNIWTSSGVTAGLDMANAFVAHLVGEENAKFMRELIELRINGQDEDEFAAVYGLVEPEA